MLQTCVVAYNLEMIMIDNNDLRANLSSTGSLPSLNRYEKTLALEDHRVQPLIKALCRAEKKQKDEAAANQPNTTYDHRTSAADTSAQAIAARSSLLVHRDAPPADGGSAAAAVALPELTAETAAASSVAAEAAHNLSLVYKASGNSALAATVAQKYLPVL